MKVYGPYTRKSDGRQHVIIIDGDKRRTVSYPKYLMEQKLGRVLHPDLETVDHKDGDFTNNHDDNLQILTRVENAKTGKNASRIAAVTTFICAHCGGEGSRVTREVRRNQHKDKHTGPFCSKRCAGYAGKPSVAERQTHSI